MVFPRGDEAGERTGKGRAGSRGEGKERRESVVRVLNLKKQPRAVAAAAAVVAVAASASAASASLPLPQMHNRAEASEDTTVGWARAQATRARSGPLRWHHTTKYAQGTLSFISAATVHHPTFEQAPTFCM